MAQNYLTPISYPSLDPWEYLHLAVNSGLTQQQAQTLSGISASTWMSWLYRPTKKNGEKNRSHLEKLHRIAADLGWLENKAIAA